MGSFEIGALIGVGGMGEVYRATDTALKRSVAIKVLPHSVSDDSDRLARFQREAEVLAALNHPHIAQIYGLERADRTLSLVMELVDGDTLAERIVHGAIPLEESIHIGAQILEALEAAHERGIVHRDLKPANIKLRPDGTVKVLDFGLAKAVEPVAMSAAGSLAPTVTTPAVTRTGVILGTAAYMSPEQARGKPVDQRTDIWAFGCVMFEMLAGRRAFGGDDVSDVLASVLARDPEWQALPSATPPGIRHLITRCLAKDARERFHHVGDVRLELRDARATTSSTRIAAAAAQPNRSSWLVPALIAGVASLIAGIALGAIAWRRPAPLVPTARLSIDAAPASEVSTGSVLGMLPGGGRLAVAWSPDGQTLAFVGSHAGTSRIYLRELTANAARPIDGTEGARALTYSADGEWIAFWTGQELRKIRSSGGPAARIASAAEVNGIAWGSSRVVFTTRYQVFEVSPDGGTPRALTDMSRRRSTPFLLPGENALLYTEYGKQFTSGDEQVFVHPFSGGGKPQLLLKEAADALPRDRPPGIHAPGDAVRRAIRPDDAAGARQSGGCGEQRGAVVGGVVRRRSHAVGSVRRVAAGDAGLCAKSGRLAAHFRPGSRQPQRRGQHAWRARTHVS